MDQPVKQRLRLYLQSEKAHGLDSLPVKVRPRVAAARAAPAAAPRVVAPPAPPRAAARAAPLAPVRREAPASQPLPVVTPAAALFGGDDQSPFSSPVMSHEEKIRVLDELNRMTVASCTLCRLHEQRTHTVFGEGDVDAQIFFIGEGPGETEDRTGRPFVGRAGHKLDEMIAAMGLKREQVYIANIVKCRPPENRAPLADETQTCTPVLVKQLEVVRPRVIVTLGLPATQFMLKTKNSMSRMRGQWYSWRGIKLMPTFHPSYILRNYTVETRKAVWSDLQKVMTELGLPRTA